MKFKDDLQKSGLILLVVLSCIECARKHNSPLDNSLYESNPKKTASLHLVDPERAKVGISKVEVKVDAFGENFKAPTFDIEFQGNDYVQILRCKDEYRPQLEKTLANIVAKSKDERKWSWYDSFGNPIMCKVTARRTKTPHYQDITARNGRFFYLINPCVSASLSSTGQDDCSFQLALSNSLTYDSSLSSAFAEKATELADAESAYDSIMSEMQGLAFNMGLLQQECTSNLDSEQNAEQRAALNKVLATLGIAAAGGGTFMGARYLLDRARKSSAKPLNKGTLTIAGLFAGAASVTLIIQGLIQKHATDHPTCIKIAEYANKLLSYNQQGLLSHAEEELIKKSSELSQLNATFEGYNEAIFTGNNTP